MTALLDWTTSFDGSFLPLLIDGSIKSILVLGVACIATLAMWKKPASARHLVWCAGLAGAVWIPLLAMMLPAWRVLPAAADISERPVPSVAAFVPRTLGYVVTDPQTMESSPPLPRLASIDVGKWIVTAWALGVIACLVPIALGHWGLRHLKRDSRLMTDPSWLRLRDECRAEMGLRCKVILKISTHPAMPMTWGLLYPVVLVPCDSLSWSPRRRRAVLLHELAHGKRFDCLTNLLAQVTRAVYWFNPLAWVAIWRMNVEQERACDDAVLNLGMRGPDYATELLEISSGASIAGNWQLAALSMARTSCIENRLREILDGGRNRRPVLRRHLLAVGLLLMLFMIPISMINNVHGQDKPTTSPAAVSNPNAATQPSDLKPAGSPIDRSTPPMTETANRMHWVTFAMWNYQKQHHGQTPPDLGATASAFKGGRPRNFFQTPGDERRTQVPDIITSDWINLHTSYVYLAPDVNLDLTADHAWEVIAFHTRLDQPFTTSKGEEAIIAAFLDAHCEVITVAEAPARIARSKKRIDAARPPGHQGATSQPDNGEANAVNENGWTQELLDTDRRMRQQVELAILAYAAQHRDHMPPDLGTTLPIVANSVNTPPLPMAKAAALYLTHRDEMRIKISDEPTPQWVNDHSSFIFDAHGVDIRKIPKALLGKCLVMHTKLDDPFSHAKRGKVVLTVWRDGHGEIFTVEEAKAAIEESDKILSAARVAPEQ